MGFSLEFFFKETREILDNAALTESEIAALIRVLLNEGEIYARECGQISREEV